MPITSVQRYKLTYLKLTYFFKLVNFKFPEFCVFAKNFLALSGRKIKGERIKVNTQNNTNVTALLTAWFFPPLVSLIRTLSKVTNFGKHCFKQSMPDNSSCQGLQFHCIQENLTAYINALFCMHLQMQFANCKFANANLHLQCNTLMHSVLLIRTALA